MVLSVLVGVNIGAPYKIIGRISESNKVINDLKESLDRTIVCFKPKINSANNNTNLTSDSVHSLNSKFTEHVCNIASNSFKKAKVNQKKYTPNNPWFNWQARLAKRELRKATKSTFNFPSSDFLRQNFYHERKTTKNSSQT